MPEAVCNGVRLHYQHLANPDAGRRAVFVHGLVMDTLASWYFFLGTRAAAVTDVVVYDLRGHGRSERPQTGYDTQTMVADLAALLDTLPNPELPVDLVGNSYGGLLAVAFALAHPARVRSLVLVDGHLCDDAWAREMRATFTLSGAELNARLQKEFQEWDGLKSERKTRKLIEAARGLVYGTELLAGIDASPPLGDGDLGRLACPVLALYGEHSDIIERGRRLEREVPNCDFRLLAGATHSVMWQATATVQQAILDWLQ